MIDPRLNHWDTRFDQDYWDRVNTRQIRLAQAAIVFSVVSLLSLCVVVISLILGFLG